ncbi:hypothetical protein PG994_012393 [Apiospora phragmitis]|uniref:Prion-inhibition and propagation HeLo domain-containing protein n=1 Tax=Apiospora phragmitis TaxID=2905665 RepID=A0ABR1TVU2_9PEZI
MAEAVGTALAVVGVLGQIFDGCVKAYGHFTTAAQFAQQSRGLACKLRIEEMRLVVWGRAWGVTEGKLEAHLMDAYGSRGGGGSSTTKLAAVGPSPLGGEGQGRAMMRSLAVQILSELHRTITDGQRLRERYGLVEDEEKGSNGSKTAGGEAKKRWSSGRAIRARMEEAAAAASGAGERSSRYAQDGWWPITTTASSSCSPPPASRIPAIRRTWVAELLESAQRDVEQLSLLENASDAVYPKLHASAGLKRLRINLNNEPHGKAAFKPTFAFRVARPALTVSDRDPKRSLGFHNQQDNSNSDNNNDNVLIQWVDYDREDLDEKFVHLRRLDQLARMMHSATDRHPDLHTIDCRGYTDDTANSRYGLVYRAPAPTACGWRGSWLSLSGRCTRSTGCTSRSAPPTSLFFPSAISAAATQPTAAAALVPDIAAPYLVGFDAARPDLDTDMSVAPKNPSIRDLHRHPQSLSSGLGGARRRRPYCKGYDVYSLGLVLLEIGLWKPLQTYYKPHYSAERWRDRVVLPVLVPGLGNRTGRVYREVVERCLTAKDDMSGKEAGQLMESVVAALESIHV